MAELVKFLISAFDLVEGRRIGLEAFGDALSAKCLVFTLRFAVRFEKVITGLVRRGCGARALAEGISGLHGAFVGDDCLVVTTHAAETERLVVAINSALFFEDVRAGHPWGGVGPCVTELVDVGDSSAVRRAKEFEVFNLGEGRTPNINGNHSWDSGVHLWECP